MSYDVDHEVKLVQFHLQRLGKNNGDGTYSISFGVFFNDGQVEQIFESLVGSLKAARKRGVMQFNGQMLLMPTNKDVELKLLQPLSPDEYQKLLKQ